MTSKIRALRSSVAAGAAALLLAQVFVPIGVTAPATAADDPIPALVGAQTQTRTTPNTISDVTNADLLGNGDALVSTFGGGDAYGFDVAKTNFWKDGSNDSGWAAGATPLRIGQVIVKIPSLSGGSYSQQQDMYNAELRASFAKSGVAVAERSRVLSTSASLLATDITNNSTSAVQVTVDTAANTAFTGTGAVIAAGVSGDTAWVSKKGPNGYGYGPGNAPFKMWAGLSTRILGATATVTTNSTDTATSAFSVPAGATVTVITQIGSTGGETLTNTPADPTPAANTAVQAVTTSSLASLGTDHSNWWSNFWHTSSVNLTTEPTLMRFYYGSLYVLASSNRPQYFAPGLFGWDGTDNPDWQGDYTMNYNVQSPYYGVYSANHPELAGSYYKSINSISTADGLSYAASLGYSGTYFRTHYGTLGIRGNDYGDFAQRTNAIESAINYLKDYSYTQDTTRLQNTLYPFLIQVANFWDAYLVKDSSGRYVVNDSAVAENDYDHKFNATTALAYLRAFYTGMIQASTDLGVDSSRRAKWQDILNNLAQYTTVTYQGKTVFSFSEDNPSAEANPYPYNLYPVFPADIVGESSPLAAVARNTIATMPSYWWQGNSFAQTYVAAAKVGYPAQEIVTNMNTILNANMGPNNFYRQSGGGLETVGAIEAIDSMLLSSTDGAIRVFPDWTGTNASFSSLRAVGAFTVSSSLSGGIVQSLSIGSDKGKTAVVRNPWPGKDLVVTQVGGGTVSTSRSAGNYSFATTAGAQYVLTPAGGLPTAVSTDLALYKDATASSSVNSGPWTAAAALDGDSRSVSGSLGWSSSSNTYANHSETFTVDLRTPQSISKVDLTPRNDPGQVGAGFPVDLTIAVSTDGTNWTNVAYGTSIPQPTSATPVSYTFTPQPAQFIRITGNTLRQNPGDGNQYRMQFAEVAAYPAVRLTGTATASSSFEASGWSVANVVNGTTTSTNGDLGWSSNSNLNANHTETLTVDLGAAKGVSAVALYPRTDGGNAGVFFPVDYSIATSTDGTNWTTVATRTGQPFTTSPVSVGFTPVLTRYVRLNVTNLRQSADQGNQYRAQLAEFTVYAGDPAPTASASSSVEFAGWGVAKLVNGTTTSTSNDMGWSSLNNSGTNHTESATIDFGVSKSMTGATLYPRTDAGNVGQGFPIDYTIAVSTDGTNWTTVVTKTGQALPTGAQTVTFSAVSARYLKVTGTNLRPIPNDNNAYRMQFAEITVAAN